MKDSFSYSELAVALECEQKFKYLFVDKLKVPELDSLALHFGTALHAGLNSLLEGGDGKAFDIYWDSISKLEFESDRVGYAGLHDMGNLFLSRFYRLHLKHYRLLHGETRLYGNLPSGIKLEGTPDAIVVYDGKLTLVDFKTSSQRYPEDRIKSADQLLIYAYLAQQHYDITIEQLAYVVFVKTKEPSIQVQTLKLDQEELKRRIRNIDFHCQRLSVINVPTRNHGACFNYGKKCKFFNLCHPETDEK